MEFYRETRYTIPRTTVYPLLSAEAIAQRFGWLEVVEFTIEWVKAVRLQQVIQERFQQTADDDYVVSLGKPERVLEGHDLFNLSGRATRFTHDGPLLADISGRSKMLVQGIS